MTEQAAGLEVAVDLNDLVEVYAAENAELHRQVLMLRAAVMKLKRDLGEPTNGEVKEVGSHGTPG